MADKFELKAVISASAKSMLATLKQVDRATRTTRKYLLDIGSSASALASKIGLPLAVAGGLLSGFSIGAVKNAVLSFTELGDELTKVAFATGMTVEQVQRMKYVAEQSNVPIEALQGSLGKLNKNIGEAATGKNKELAALFAKLKIPLRDVNGQLRSGVDMLPQLSDAFVRNKNPVVQARLGMALYGKAWQEIIPLMMEGSDGIERSLKRFETLKGVISASDVQGAKEFGDQLRDLSIVTKGFQMTVAKELVPVLRPLIEDLIQWAAANKKLIASKVKEVVKGLITEIKKIDWQAVVTSVQNLFGSIESLVGLVGGLKNFIVALFLIANAGTIAAIFSLGGAILRAGWALGALALANPILAAIVVAVGLLAAGAIWVYRNWDTVKNFFANFLTNVANGMSYLAGFVIGQWLKTTQLFMDAITALVQPIAQVWLDLWTNPRKLAEDFFNFVVGKFEGLLDLIKRVKEYFTNFSASDVGSNFDAGLRASGGANVNLIGAGNQNLRATVDVNLNGAPPGTRVEGVKGDKNVDVGANVGVRGFAMGAP